jgi:hypothetical protein
MSVTASPSITTWTRLEPRARGDSLAPSLQASVYDPAWMLARQWQLAEFRGQDAAFPVSVSYTVDVQPLTGYQPPADGSEAVGQYPLEAFAWPEPATALTAGASAQFGAELLRLLSEHGCSAASTANIVAAYPLSVPADSTVDAQGSDYLTLMAGRLPDTSKLEPVLRSAIASGGSLPSQLGVAPADVSAVVAAATAWLAQLDSFGLPPAGAADAWEPSRLEHQFSVTVGSAKGPAFTLAAPSWPGRRLEWSDFDVAGRAAASAQSNRPNLPGVNNRDAEVSGSGPPHPLTYPGAPNRRYWTFEDANFNLAAVTVGTDDLARMLIVEFACVYGNDWYLQPIPLPAGALHTIRRLTVTNSFGESEVLGPVAPSIPMFGSPADGTPDWCIFRSNVVQEDGTTATLNGLFLPPSIVQVQASPPIEEVVFIRDDTADIGWAVEHTVLGADERPFDRYSAAMQQAPAPAAPPADDSSTVRYLLETDIPPYCYALIPDPAGQPPPPQLLLRRVGVGGQFTGPPPLGQVLSGLQNQPLFDQEVPVVGTTVRRRRYVVRGFDGEVLMWTGRERLIGGHYGTVPLAFDQVLAE